MAPTPVTSPTRRFVLAGLAALLFAVPTSAAKSGSCYVTPDPVLLGSDFTLVGSSLTPFGYYWINITQAKDSSNGAHPQSFMQADSSGSFSYTRNTSEGPDGVLGVGRAKARIYPMTAVELGFPTTAAGTANCWFEVS